MFINNEGCNMNFNLLLNSLAVIIKINVLPFLLLIFFCMNESLYAIEMKEAYKFAYNGSPEKLNGTVITVNEKYVALSEKIKVPVQIDSVLYINPLSIFFLIDRSASMYNRNGADPKGARFTVTQALIDTLYKKCPHAEVGIGVFTCNLYYRNVSPYLASCPRQDSGLYIPLLRLDSSYTPNGKSGYAILDSMFDTTINQYINYDTIDYVDLNYWPDPPWENFGTNITAGFDAARHAMESSSCHRSRHFIIFFSDGNANVPINDNTERSRFMKGDTIPTTYTIFFTGDPEPPDSLVMMTEAINNNDYCEGKELSKLWAFDNNNNDLSQFIMNNIFNSLASTRYKIPDSIAVTNGTIVVFNTNWIDSIFTLPDLFPLTDTITTFSYIIKYKNIIDTIINGNNTIIYRDTMLTLEYKIKSVEGAPDLADNFTVHSWKRGLGFYYNNQEITSANKAQDSLEIRFKYDPGDAHYNYTNVKVDVVSKKGYDKETFVLSHNNDYYSCSFKRELKPCVIGNSIIEHEEIDTLIAIFRNNENPKLLLDTINVPIAFISGSNINFENRASKKFSFSFKKSLSGENRIFINNLPLFGKISIFELNGREVFQRNLKKGSTNLILPDKFAQSFYLVCIKYGTKTIKKKILLQ